MKKDKIEKIYEMTIARKSGISTVYAINLINEKTKCGAFRAVEALRQMKTKGLIKKNQIIPSPSDASIKGMISICEKYPNVQELFSRLSLEMRGYSELSPPEKGISLPSIDDRVSEVLISLQKLDGRFKKYRV